MFSFLPFLLVILFLRKKKSPQKAEVYLQGALKTYLAEGWTLLITHTRKQLAECQKHLGQTEKYPFKKDGCDLRIIYSFRSIKVG